MRVLDVAGRWVRLDLNEPSGFLDGGPARAHLGGDVPLIGLADGTQLRASYAHVYRANPWLWACVNLIARSASRFPLKVYKLDNDDNTQQVKPGAGSRAATFAAALHRPGNGRSQSTLVHATFVDRLVNGNALWFPDRDAMGGYTGMRRIPWRYAAYEIVAGVERYWDVRKPNDRRLADDVVHFGAALDCDDVVNPSPIMALRATWWATSRTAPAPPGT